MGTFLRYISSTYYVPVTTPFFLSLSCTPKTMESNRHPPYSTLVANVKVTVKEIVGGGSP